MLQDSYGYPAEACGKSERNDTVNRDAARPGGPITKREPSPEGLGINPEDDLSAAGAALSLGPLRADGD